MPDYDDSDVDEIIRIASSQSPNSRIRKSAEKYPQVVPGSLQWNSTANKQEVLIRCQQPGCTEQRYVFASDLFQVTKCIEHARQERARKRAERAQRIAGLNLPESMSRLIEDLDDNDEFISKRRGGIVSPEEIEAIISQLPPEQRQRLQAAIARNAQQQRCDSCGEMVDPNEMDIHGVGRCDQRECPRCGSRHRCVRLECFVSDVPVTEELGGIRPAHLLIKAKHDSSWIEYVDEEGNTKFMQVHDVRSARDRYGRWAVYGVDQNGDPVHELYDLRQGFEHSSTFSGIRELDFKEVVRLAQQGVIRGKDGKEVGTLSGLMQIADEPLRKLIIKKYKEAKVGGPSLAQIEKQLFAEPTASSAQKRRTGKAGTRPWARKLMSS